MKAPAESIAQTISSITNQFILNVQQLSNTSNVKLPPVSIYYRNWWLGTKVINGHTWLQWQHPQERVPRYGTQVYSNRLQETIAHARFLIDLMINMEQEAALHSLYPQIGSLDTAHHSNGGDLGNNATNNHSNLAPAHASDSWEDQEEFLLIESCWGSYQDPKQTLNSEF